MHFTFRMLSRPRTSWSLLSISKRIHPPAPALAIQLFLAFKLSPSKMNSRRLSSHNLPFPVLPQLWMSHLVRFSVTASASASKPTINDEDFDLTLSVNHDIVDAQRTRVYAGVPGNLTTHIPHYAFYSTSLTDLEGEQTIASFTVLDDLRVEGMIIRNGETYSISPVEFLQAYVATDTKTGRSATLVSLHYLLLQLWGENYLL